MIGVSAQTDKKERRCKPSLGRGKIRNRSKSYFSIQMIDEIEVQAAFKRLLTGYESVVIVHALSPSQYNCTSSLLELRSASTPKHLHHLQISIFLATTVGPACRSLDDYKITWKVDTNSKGGSAADDADIMT